MTLLRRCGHANGVVMKDPLECSLFDEEIIDEQLSADINPNDLGRIKQMGRRPRFVAGKRLRPRRPLVGQFDAVVKAFARRGGIEAMK